MKNTIFVCVDAQNDFMEPQGGAYIPEAKNIIPNIEFLCQLAKDTRSKTIYTRELSTLSNNFREDVHGSEFINNINVLRDLDQHVDIFNEDYMLDAGMDLGSRIDEADHLVLHKNTSDVFLSNHYALPMFEYLLENYENLRAIVFGVPTQGSVNHVVQKLADLGIEVCVPVDAIKEYPRTRMAMSSFSVFTRWAEKGVKATICSSIGSVTGVKILGID